MERAVFITDLKHFKFDRTHYQRLYFGIEFCENLLPSLDQLVEASLEASKNGLKLTFVTPFVTDTGMEKLEILFNGFLKDHEDVEIVINDWGFFYFLKKHSWNGPIILGRLLTKQKRGPRILNVSHKLPPDALEHFKQSNIDVPILANFLAEQGIHRVELDNLLQGVSRPQPFLKGSLYYPYAYVTTTRYCLAARSEKQITNFRAIIPCNRECQKYEYELTHKSMPVKLLLKGNTQFFVNENLPCNLSSLNIDRLVFEPNIPI